MTIDSKIYKKARVVLDMLPDEWEGVYTKSLDEISRLERVRTGNTQIRLQRAVEILESGSAIHSVDFSDLLSEIWVSGLETPHIVLKYNKFLIDKAREG